MKKARRSLELIRSSIYRDTVLTRRLYPVPAWILLMEFMIQVI